MLVNDPSYSWLSEIGIKEVNDGVYNGSWGGSGNVVTSVSPINEQPIAQVVEVGSSFVDSQCCNYTPVKLSIVLVPWSEISPISWFKFRIHDNH